MHDVACEFACAVGCAETISANVLKSTRLISIEVIIPFLAKFRLYEPLGFMLINFTFFAIKRWLKFHMTTSA